MILDINKQLDEIFKEELLQAEVITTECSMINKNKTSKEIRTHKNSNSKIVSINK